MQVQRAVFDAHFHIGAYGERESSGRLVRPILPDRDHKGGKMCSEYLDRYGLKGGVIVPTYFDQQEIAFEYNDLVLAACEADERLIGGLFVTPLEDWMGHSRSSLQKLPSTNIRALKMAPNKWPGFSINPSTWDSAMSRNMDELMQSASDHDLIVHFHSGYAAGADPSDFDGLIRRYGQETKIQIVHMGEAVKPAFKFVPHFIEWLKEGYLVWTDTSIVPGFAPIWLLEELDTAGLGYDRLMFATDSPWGLFESEYWKIEALEVAEEVKDAIFFGNAGKLFGSRTSS